MERVRNFMLNKCRDFPDLSEEILYLYLILLDNIINKNKPETEEIQLFFNGVYNLIDDYHERKSEV